MRRVKERLKQYRDEFSKNRKFDAVFVSSIMDMIEQLQDDLEQDEKENGWIPVSERLPEKEDLFIVTYCGELVGATEPFTGMNYYENGKWDSDGNCVTAWMPLPEPYKED